MWSALGPPRDMCNRNPQPGNGKKHLESTKIVLGIFACKRLWLMVRETVPSQQQHHCTTSKRIKTTASSPLEKFTSDGLNQNGDLSQSGLSHVIGLLAYVRPALPIEILPLSLYLLMAPFLWRGSCAQQRNHMLQKIPEAARWWS